MPKEYIEKEAALEIAAEQSNDWLYDAINAIPAANVRENDELDELINEAVLTLNNIYIACRIKKDDYVRLLNDICAIRGAEMTGGNDGERI